MKGLLIALSMVSVFCVGCKGNDGDTEPIKPSGSASAGTAASDPLRPVDSSRNVANAGGTDKPAEGDLPIGELKSSHLTKN